MTSSHITAIETAIPENEVQQKEALEFMIAMNSLNDTESRQLEVLYRATGIDKRYSVLSDYAKTSNFKFYPNNEESIFPDTRERMELFRVEALKLSKEAIAKVIKQSGIKKEEVTHLITVSCTGIHAPGLDIDIVSSIGLNTDVQRTAINFMGCYAAFNALKLADSICQSTDSKVLIVCVELCSIHFQKGKDEDNQLANALFGDGCASLLVESNTKNQSLQIVEKHCELLSDGKNEMAWGIGPFGFEMKLSSYVPEIINIGIHKLLAHYKEKYDFYAIHPGGKKILNIIEESLGITKNQNSPAHKVLRNYGNMSSPTVLFVLKEVFDSISSKDQDKEVLSLAFGPGLTLESMTFKINCHA